MTHFSKNGLPYGDMVETAEILPEGIPSIKRLGEYLKNIQTDANFTSPYKRCLETSGIVSEITGKKFVVDENLRDWDPRNGTVEEMVERILTFCHNMQHTTYNSLSLCTHGYPINAIVAFFIKGKIESDDLDNYPETGVLTTIEDGKVNYINFNIENIAKKKP